MTHIHSCVAAMIELGTPVTYLFKQTRAGSRGQILLRSFFISCDFFISFVFSMYDVLSLCGVFLCLLVSVYVAVCVPSVSLVAVVRYIS